MGEKGEGSGGKGGGNWEWGTPLSTPSLLQVAIYKLLQICENENSSLDSKSLSHVYGCGTWFILICNLLVIICNFIKKCNISNSIEQKYISQIFAIYIYV